MLPSSLSQRVLLVLIDTVLGIVAGYCLAEPGPLAQPTATPVASKGNTDALREKRRQFQVQELVTATPFTWIFNPGDPPRIVWRDVDEVRRLGFRGHLNVRWFNTHLEEAALPNKPGRWIAWIDGTAPNGLPFRRALTFFVRPKNFLMYLAPELTVTLPYFPGPINADVWHEHQVEIGQLSANMLLHGINDSEAGAIILAGLFELKQLGRPARFVESATVLNQDYHLAVKIKVERLQERVRTLRPPRQLTKSAPILHQATMEEAEMAPDAKAKIDAVCRDWAADTGEPFVALVARHGVVVTHEAFGQDLTAKPINIDYRCWVGSITKSVTALLFSQFLDQNLIDLDDSLAAVFPDYPRDDPHVPTFRQCFNHTSGLSGHGNFGAANNPHLENIILNGIDANEPNVRYTYSGMGYDLAVKAMEIVAGKSFVRLFDEHLFRPLDFGDAPIGNASSEGHFTARELGILGQMIANHGSYGELQFFSPATFYRLLPQAIQVRDRNGVEDEGIGLHWIRRLKPNAPASSRRAEDQLFSVHTVGHGSLSGCIFIIDLDRQLVIAQVRRQMGARHGEWSAKFFKRIADAINDDNGLQKP